MRAAKKKQTLAAIIEASQFCCSQKGYSFSPKPTALLMETGHEHVQVCGDRLVDTRHCLGHVFHIRNVIAANLHALLVAFDFWKWCQSATVTALLCSTHSPYGLRFAWMQTVSLQVHPLQGSLQGSIYIWPSGL